MIENNPSVASREHPKIRYAAPAQGRHIKLGKAPFAGEPNKVRAALSVCAYAPAGAFSS